MKDTKLRKQDGVILIFNKHSESKKTVGFITFVHGRCRGVRENSKEEKIIVLPDIELEKKIQLNTPYRCTLVPMNNKTGFVAVSASLVTYEAKIEVTMFRKSFSVKVRFGNRYITYDPLSPNIRKNSFESISEYIKGLQCISNADDVIEELRESINIAAAQYV